MPDPWAAIVDVLRPFERESPPPPPLLLSGWNFSSNLEKMLRLQQQVGWVDAKGSLEELGAYFEGIPDNAWHHRSEGHL